MSGLKGGVFLKKSLLKSITAYEDKLYKIVLKPLELNLLGTEVRHLYLSTVILLASKTSMIML